MNMFTKIDLNKPNTDIKHEEKNLMGGKSSDMKFPMLKNENYYSRTFTVCLKSLLLPSDQPPRRNHEEDAQRIPI